MTTTAVEQLEQQYPQIAQTYREISERQYQLFAAKMIDYGKGNISVGTNLDTSEEVNLALTGLWFRINDKVNRLKNLIALKQKPNVTTEAIEDTFQDLSVYGIIAQIVKRGDWR